MWKGEGGGIEKKVCLKDLGKGKHNVFMRCREKGRWEEMSLERKAGARS